MSIKVEVAIEKLHRSSNGATGMNTMYVYCLIVCALVLAVAARGPPTMYADDVYEPIHARPCRRTDKQCVFTLEVVETLTMVYRRTLLFTYQGRLYNWNDDPTNPNVSAIDPANVVVSDGFMRPIRMLTFNGTVPGPDIVAWENQEIIINVHNKDISEAISVHWHGLHQRNSGWYDGIPWLTQCPQLPGEIFTQRFKAYPYGSFWYHSHVGIQLSDSLYGAFIIHPKKAEQPLVSGDFNVMFGDINHEVIGNAWYLYLTNNIWSSLAAKYNDSSLDQRYHSLVVNGRGRYQAPDGTFLTESPLTEFEVVPGKVYRFRIIGSQATTFVTFSIDGHRMQVIATDGRDLKPQWVTHVQVTPGERYDVLVVADQPVDTYWIRASRGLAILRYRGATSGIDPNSTTHRCAQNETTCIVYNCDAFDFARPNQECITFDRMRSKYKQRVPGRPGGSRRYRGHRIRESLFNFGFKRGPRVNGVRYQVPVSPILTQPGEAQENPCYEPCQTNNTCECTYNHHMKLGEIQQFVILSLGIGRSNHPIHMHGHHFYVVKIGLPQMNSSGAIIGQNEDLICDDPIWCNRARWRNSTWGGNNIPGLNLFDPPLKDTVLVPAGGYVVIRFKADNPGAWGLHCHIEPHLMFGMFVALIEGFEKFDSFDIPPRFPTCRHYTPEHYRPYEDMDYYGYSSEHENDRYGSTNSYIGRSGRSRGRGYYKK
ncbi:uncharacterized protein LOC141910498 [Tubulanus polymorphus]|uniref:uncharacterized protein LOC141910498 n=1 Tax=Tubulanus polymorphus TaxID=672921 RepID=UPI003DA60E6E